MELEGEGGAALSFLGWEVFVACSNVNGKDHIEGEQLNTKERKAIIHSVRFLRSSRRQD